MEKKGLTKYLSPLGVWALAFGSAVGWGSFVMPGSTFLPIAGPLGSVLGILIGAGLMLLIGVNYAYMMKADADAGGTFTYTKRCFGYDHGFLSAWFLILTYVAIIWANATALPLIARNLLGGTFCVGFHYQIAGFDVYLGEVLLAVAALGICGLLCLRVCAAGGMQIAAALVLILGIVVCFAAVYVGRGVSIEPAFAPGIGKARSVLNIVALAPWAYVGFESVSHSTEEFRFPVKKVFRIMVAALIAAAAAYGLLVLLAVGALPEGYASWTQYLADLDGFSGVKGLPTFYAASTVMGGLGVPVLGITALCGIITGLIGNLVASSRLLYAMAEDGMLPPFFSRRNKSGAPSHAILVLLAVSAVMPFFGRTAISWIVDVTTIGAAIAYAYTSACTIHAARKNGDRRHFILGSLGAAVSGLFLLFFLVPNMLAISALSVESYLILSAWSILGMFCFYRLLRRDEKQRLGRSMIVWLAFLLLIFFTALIWMRQSTWQATEASARQMEAGYHEILEELGETHSEDDHERTRELIDSGFKKVNRTLNNNSLVQMALILTALFFLQRINIEIRKRQQRTEVEKALAEESSRAKTSFLSNMSHEIRTPMNAIIGLDNIALRDPELTPRTRENLEKIGASAQHLLGLINDILDMSRIESGRMVLKKEEFAFRDFLDQINTMIGGQCMSKGLHYECSIIGNVDDYYVGDDLKLKQVLINILGNAVKFTEPGGEVSLTVEQKASFEGFRTLRFIIKDSGIGMDKEYLPKIFEAFSQEDATTTNSYGGSGLGMAITKNIVEMMNGEIGVDSEKGVGTTFTVTVTLSASDRSAHGEQNIELPADLRVLIVDDDEVACEHVQLVLNALGLDPAVAHSGGEALGRMRAMHEMGKPYQILLTDYKMPGMDGMELTHALREFDCGETDIIFMTGYNWDDVQDEAEAAGIAAIMSKPIFADSLQHEIQSILSRKAAGTEEQADEPEEQEDDFSELSGRRILIAEDIEINAEILADLLEMVEIESERAENGQIAVDMFSAAAEGYYDAVLMDVRMPVMDGLAATRAIRALDRPDAKTVPIIALTANAFDEDVKNSLQAGMDAHLNKPVESDQLYHTLIRLIAEKGRT